ncbi:MAG: tryptophan--tRNA ligase [Bacilli bacterium]|nr:tryptophan--tRNA ligase [Bacilli bacterium]
MAIILSGIKPTGIPTLGNYLGALKNFVKLQNERSEDKFLFFIADLHAITIPQNPAELRSNIKSLAALYLACGLNKESLVLFIQSEVAEHAELGYIMQSLAYMGELERMTQFKEKSKKQESGVTSALFTYPALMAADILLYNTDLVPVGEDQVQHLELTRDLAIRFNNRYSDTFKVPEGLVTKVGARIMDLQNPLKKMSKSEDPGDKGCIFLLDPIDLIKKKIKSAVTDSDAVVKYDKANKPGISNLMTIYSCITGEDYKAIEAKYAGIGYGEFKSDLADIVADEVSKIQERYNKLINSTELDEILDKGKDEASFMARKQLSKVYRKVGLGRKK